MTVPTAAAIPTELRGLSSAVLLAVRPLVVHQGQPKQHSNGYTRKDKMTMLSWHRRSCEERISGLVGNDATAARQALSWLLKNSKAYRRYYREHAAVLASGQPLALPPSALLEPYLECALWPHLYPVCDWAESHMWGGKWRRPFRSGATEKVDDYDSPKAAFVAKLRCEIADYGASYELLQFQFDRALLRAVSGRGVASAKSGMDMAFGLHDKHWTPMYWKDHHRVLQDVVLQRGPPQLFVTVSPWEQDFPWPRWVDHVHRAMGCVPTDAAGPETLAIAHALRQCIAGFLAGHTGGNWTAHWLGDKSGGRNPVLGYFARFEFQDGGSQHEYGKGRASLHTHALFWLERTRTVHLESILAAEMPSEDTDLREVVQRVQRSDSASHAPVREGVSAWQWQGGRWCLHLRQPASFRAGGFRPYIPAVLRVFRCSQDVQWWHSGTPLLRYVAGYVSKFSEAWDDSWLESNTAWSAALTVLQCWKPGAAEQVMFLARGGMAFSSMKSCCYTPVAFGAVEDSARELYRRRCEAEETFTFLEWLRRYRIVEGAFGATPVRRRASFFAVGVRYSSPCTSAFFWQWLQMHVPFRRVQELCPSRMWLVSEPLQTLAAALLLRPGTWDAPEWVREHFRLAGHKEEWICTMSDRLQARIVEVHAQWEGLMPKFASFTLPRATVLLSPEQQRLYDRIALELELRAEHCETHPFVRFVTGGPGSGKTTLLDAVVFASVSLEQRVLRVSPTGRVASAGARHPCVCNATVARIFGQSQGFNENVAGFTLWVVGEVGMLSKEAADTIWSHWVRCGKAAVLIFEGDFQQLPPGLGSTPDARAAPWWKSLRQWSLRGVYRCEDDALLALLKHMRFSTPSEKQLAVLEDLVVGESVDGETLRKAWAMLPHATVLTATRRTAALVNHWGAAFCEGEILGAIPVWTGENNDVLENLVVKKGMLLEITRNLAVDEGVVNGETCVVRRLTWRGIEVQLTHGGVRVLHRRWQRMTAGMTAAFDLGLGYAATVHRAEGATLDAIIICWESWCLPGWAYTALSRVRRLQDIRCIGVPLPWHCGARVLE